MVAAMNNNLQYKTVTWKGWDLTYEYRSYGLDDYDLFSAKTPAGMDVLEFFSDHWKGKVEDYFVETMKEECKESEIENPSNRGM